MERSAWPKNLSSSGKGAIQELCGQNPKKLRDAFDAHSQTGDEPQQPSFAGDLVVRVLGSFSSNTQSLSSGSESYEVSQVPGNACVMSGVSTGSETVETPVQWSPESNFLEQSAAAVAGADRQKPTIIFDISPKVIHVEERNFMSIVQQLTGSSSSSDARVVAIERTSPTGREKGFATTAAAAAEMGGPSVVAVKDELMCMLVDVQLAQSQGILTPAAPPARSAGFFSPATEPDMSQDLSPFWPTNNSYNSPSASTWFTPFSPSPIESSDIFNYSLNY